MTDRQTDRQTTLYSVGITIDCIYIVVGPTAMRPKTPCHKINIKTGARFGRFVYNVRPGNCSYSAGAGTREKLQTIGGWVV